MKKVIFFIIIFLAFLTAPSGQAADDACHWAVVSRVIGGSTAGQSSDGGGCNQTDQISDNKKCSSAVKPEYSALLGQSLQCCCGSVKIKGDSDTLFKAPDLQIEIPGMEKLSDITCVTGEDCSIPWIGQYIKGIYNYAIAIAGILAAVVMMAGGLLWLLSRGDSSKITKAKDLIIGGVVGMIILSGSYLILTIINPNLVNLSNIAVTRIDPIYLTGYKDVDMTTVPTHKTYVDACTHSKTYNDWSVCRGLGQRKPEGLILLASEGVWVNSEVSQKYLAALECVKSKNNGQSLFRILSSWRSPIRQVELREAYDVALAQWSQTQSGAKPTSVAFPCCSNHGSGYAMDLVRLDKQSMSWAFNDSSGLKECMNAQGLFAKIEDEPWHWSLSGY